MKKFFEVVASDLRLLWNKNRVAVVLFGSLIILALLSLIPTVGAAITFMMNIIAYVVIGLAILSATWLLYYYIRKTINKIKW